jgi:hypothetical protein
VTLSRRAYRLVSVFLAIKYASPAMAKLCVEKGKTIPGGSIILPHQVRRVSSRKPAL